MENCTKNPVIIEAFQYDGDFMNCHGDYYVPEWAKEAERKGTLFFVGAGELYIDTLDGKMHVSVGDYIIKGIKGELYPCKPDVFNKTYTRIKQPLNA